MSSPITLDRLCHGVAELVRKRGLVTEDQLADLIELLRNSGAADLSDLRRWVVSCPHLIPELKDELRKIIKLPRQASLGGFTIMGHLADGGMGDVWLAEGEAGNLAVVKTLLPDLAQDAEFLLRFEREVQITASMDSPYVARSLGQGQSDDGTMYLALEYVAGGDLFNLVNHRDKLLEEEALLIMRQVAMGLEAADRFNLVHRDIKPENILIGNDGKVRIVDFGLARSTNNDRTVLTVAGSTLGTPDYMSPEQICGERDLDIRSDLYAMGCVLYFCLAGQVPFRGDSISVMKQHLEDPPPNLHKRGHCSKATMAVIAKCMAKHCSNRYQTPGEVIKAIDHALGSQGMEAHDLAKDLVSESLPQPQFAKDNPICSDVHIDLDVGIDDDFGMPLPTPEDLLLDGGEAPLGLDVLPPSPALDPKETLSDWLVLRGDGRCMGVTLHIFARESLILGKTRGNPVDICLRWYPREEHDKYNSRVSRQHMRLRHDTRLHRAVLSDLGSTNGTVLDGDTMEANREYPLFVDHKHEVTIPRAMAVTMRSLPDLGGEGNGGVLIQRLKNTPHMAYLMCTGTINLGAVQGIAGLKPEDDFHLRHDEHGWQWVEAKQSQAPWFDLVPGARIELNGAGFSCSRGDYDSFR